MTNNNQTTDEQNNFTFTSELIRAQVEDKQLVQKNHQKIIEAATQLFGKVGFHNTTIRQIVKESGVGIGSIYQYVNNKEEILVLILEYFLKQFEFKLSKATESDDHPYERLKKGMDRYYRLNDDEHEKITLAYASTISLSKPYRNFVKELELKTNKVFEEILEQGVEKGEFINSIDINLVAYDIIMFGHMWALKRWYFKSRMTIDEYIDQQLEHVTRIIK